MKNTNTIIADRKAINYFCLLSEVRAKLVLFTMCRLKGDQRLSDSFIPEVRHIAAFYDGVIQSAFAKELAKKFAEEYTKQYPGTLLTKKASQAYTEVNHGKLLTELGHHGLDYVLTVLRIGKAYVANPANGIEEKHMLNALRWVERREDQDKEKSNAHHRKKGLELLGFGEMARELVNYSFIIANLYELVTPGAKVNVPTEAVAESVVEPVMAKENKQLTAKEMLNHFIDKTGLLKDFYGAKAPAIPEGYAADELTEGSMVLALAGKGLLKDSEAVLAYVEQQKVYAALVARMKEEFVEVELEAIRKHERFITGMFVELVNW